MGGGNAGKASLVFKEKREKQILKQIPMEREHRPSRDGIHFPKNRVRMGQLHNIHKLTDYPIIGWCSMQLTPMVLQDTTRIISDTVM